MRFYKTAKDTNQNVVQANNLFIIQADFAVLLAEKARNNFEKVGLNELISEYLRVAVIVHQVGDDIEHFPRSLLDVGHQNPRKSLILR